MAMTPGWYPDPFSSAGYVRWWDGARWGASVLLPEGTPAPPPGQPVALPPPGQAQPAGPAPAALPQQPPAPPGSMPPPPPGWAPPPGPAYGAPAYGAPRAAQAPYEIASYGLRAAARIIDWILEGIVLVPITIALLRPALDRFLAALPADGTLPPEAMQQWITDVTSVSLLLTLATLAVTFVYEVPQHALWGRTVGKRVVGIRVRPRDADRAALGWGVATIRWAVESGGAAVIGGLFSIVDYLWPLWDNPWRQTVHDKAAKTTVVPMRRG